MKLVYLKNVTNCRKIYPQVRNARGRILSFEPGETVPVTPAAVKHPTVSLAIGKGLELVGDEKSKQPAIETPASPKAVVAVPTLPIEVNKEETITDSSEPTMPAGSRELYLTAPGVTEYNVDNILTSFPTLVDLSEASKDILIDECGVSKAYAKRLLTWATDTLQTL
jgi:hypothetical protein